jgi:hypothetical protein
MMDNVSGKYRIVIVSSDMKFKYLSDFNVFADEQEYSEKEDEALVVEGRTTSKVLASLLYRDLSRVDPCVVVKTEIAVPDGWDTADVWV